MRALTVLALLCLASLLIMSLAISSPSPDVSTLDLQKALSDPDGKFAAVTPGRSFSFPLDHGEHPGFKTEWWYFTGNLTAQSGRRFGYQITLFQVALNKADASANPSQWSADSVMMGHFALSDIEEQSFVSFERFSRRALGLAGVAPDGSRIWLENWEIERSDNGWHLRAQASEEGQAFEIDLDLQASKPPVLQGEAGYSRKGPDPKHASYYVAQTRLATSGHLSTASGEFAVSGDSWFDHEWSSEALAEGLVGWDWFSLQLSDNSELMIYLLRYSDGRLEPASSGAIIAPDGSKTPLQLKDFSVSVTDHHRSPRGVSYPSQWKLRVEREDMLLQVTPLLADQEMTSGIPYWEGAVEVRGSKAQKAISGYGFVEMTGY